MGGLRPAPPYLSLFRGSLVQELVPAVPLAWQAALRRKWLSSRGFFLTWFGPLHSCASGSALPSVALCL